MLRRWLATLCIKEVGVLGGRCDRLEEQLAELADAHSALVERVNRFQNRVGMRQVRAQRTDGADLAELLQQARTKLPGANSDFPEF